MIIDLKEIFADPLFADNPPGLQEMKSLATNTPQTAHAFMRLYEAYRKSNERMAGVDDVLMREQAGNLQTSYEEVRDFFHYADNYVDPLDRAAEELANELALIGHNKIERLIDYCQRVHELSVEFVMPNKRDMIRQFDRTRRVIRMNTTLEKSTQFFQLANQLALLEQTSLINQILADANFKRDEARAICRIGLANYYAGALLMPYSQFLKEAQAVRYDIEIMAQRFGASWSKWPTASPLCSARNCAAFRSFLRGSTRRAPSPNATRPPPCNLRDLAALALCGTCTAPLNRPSGSSANAPKRRTESAIYAWHGPAKNAPAAFANPRDATPMPWAAK